MATLNKTSTASTSQQTTTLHQQQSSSTGMTGAVDKTKVKGEEYESVKVQSQLATSTVHGENKITSNIDRVITDLSAIHGAHSGWVEEQTKLINQRGQSEIQKSLSQVKILEEQLRKQTLEKQTIIEEEHKAKLARLVQELDAEKAAKLKELQDALQRQLQASLTTSQKDIAIIESRMNEEKMNLLKEAQLRSAKEVAGVSALQVESGLKPSITRTVIETQTNAGSVKAVASGGVICTGSASSECVSTGKVEAVPTAGKLTQETQATVGDMVKTSTGEKVGSGAIVSTQTTVRERQVAGGDVRHELATSHHGTTGHVPLATGAAVGGAALAGQHSTAPAPPAGAIVSQVGDQTYNKGAHSDITYVKPGQSDPRPVLNDGINKTAADAGHHDGTAHKGGLLSKVKNALGGHHGEPKSTDATRHH